MCYHMVGGLEDSSVFFCYALEEAIYFTKHTYYKTMNKKKKRIVLTLCLGFMNSEFPISISHSTNRALYSEQPLQILL